MPALPIHLDAIQQRDVARRAWVSWLVFTSLIIVVTLVILIATAPHGTAYRVQVWPWQHTDIALRLALFVMVVLPLLRLSQQTRELFQLRTEKSLLEQEMRRQVHTEERLLSANETLEQRVTERTAALERRTRALQTANAQLQEKNVRLQELNDAAQQFVDNISHEFRTPLTVVKEYANTLRESLSDDLTPDLVGFFDVIDNRIYDLNVMVNDLLDISRLEADILRMSRRVVRPEAIVERALVTLERKAARNEVEFTPKIAAGVPAVFCDAEKIGRVLINLGINAMKFAQRGGHVTLWVRSDPGATDVHFGVTDDGPGIPPDQIESIFERFNQLRNTRHSSTNGFGLGLSIARELVLLNLGTIHVESSPGVGSLFWFSVPVAEPEHVLARYIECLPDFHRASRHVSLVRVRVPGSMPRREREDLHNFLENQLRRCDILFESDRGGWVLVAATGDDGVRELIERWHDEYQRVNQTRPRSPLVGFEAEIVGTWCAEAQRPDLTRTFRSLLATPPVAQHSS